MANVKHKKCTPAVPLTSCAPHQLCPSPAVPLTSCATHQLCPSLVSLTLWCNGHSLVSLTFWCNGHSLVSLTLWCNGRVLLTVIVQCARLYIITCNYTYVPPRWHCWPATCRIRTVLRSIYGSAWAKAGACIVTHPWGRGYQGEHLYTCHVPT